LAKTPRERLLALRLQKGHAAAQPLSFAQERFWFLDQLEPGSTEFHITTAALLEGRLDLESLQLAFEQVVRRHESLRSVFPDQDGRPTVRVLERVVVALPLTPLTSKIPLDDAIRRVHRVPFDMQQGPLWRAELLQLGPDRHALVLCLHHIISDGWSVGLMANELAAHYNAHARGTPLAPLPAPRSFRELVQEERRGLEGEHLAELITYWKEALAGAEDATQLPFDHPLPALASHAGRTLEGRLSKRASLGIKALASKRRSTPFQVLLALFGSFLARITEASGLVIGTSYAGRDRSGSRDVLGAFVGTLPLRLNIDTEQSLEDAIGETREVLGQATKHAALPFEKLIAELGKQRDARRTPLFNVFFELVVRPGIPEWSELAARELDIDYGEAPFDLALSADVSKEAFGLRLQYKTALFENETILELLHSFERFAEAALKDPAAATCKHSLVSEARLAKQLEPEVPSAPFEAVSVTLERAAELHKARAAIETAQGPITYAALDEEAARLAQTLLERLGHPPIGATVGVALERSAEAVIAALAIWKAGCVYVPLDPGEPAARRAKILGALDLKLVLTTRDHAAEFDEALDVTAWRCALRGAALPRNARAVQPEDTAYVIFTSGSTGQPKGVAVPHRALANHIAWVQDAFAFPPTARVLLRTPLGFDASLWELVNPLARGACLVIANRAEAEDGRALLALARQERITILQTVPSILRAWLEEPDFRALADLDTLICAGEALPQALAAEVLAHVDQAQSGARLFNLYGPTEACVDAIWEETQSEMPRTGCYSAPIGKPIHGTTAIVLDAGQRPLPDGVTGELYLAGAGLALGYLGLPEETALRFVELEFARVRRCFYRTGDRARRLAGEAGGGRFEAVGRNDEQVKVRGHRVELGEVDAVLLAQPGVVRAAVIALVAPDSGAQDTASLHAFVVGEIEHGLHERLREQLPRAMVPSTITHVESMPLTSSEKLDRRALADRIPAGGESGGVPVRAPHGAIETWLAAQLAELLGTSASCLDAGADFFQLGGHSLLATRWLARARKHFEVELALGDFLAQPTIAALARCIQGALRGALQDERRQQAIPRAADREALPLSKAQERLWLLVQRQEGASAYNMPGGLRLRGPLNALALEQAINGLVARHATLRTQLCEAPAGASFPALQVVATERRLALNVERASNENAVAEWLTQEARRQPDLATDTLFRAQLFALGPDEHALLFNLHHILGDGWSLGVFATELSLLYRSAAAGIEAELEPLAIEFADFAAWERALPAPDLSEWLQVLQEAPALVSPLNLPSNRVRPQVRTFAGEEVALHVPDGLATSLRACAERERLSLHRVLFTTFVCFLARVCGVDDLVIGAPIAGRARAETQGLIGFFVSALPVRTLLPETRDFHAALATCSEAVDFALMREDAGLDELLSALTRAGCLEPFANSMPLFQVGFDYAPEELPLPKLAGLEVEAIEFHSGTAKLDLNVLVEEHESGLRVRAEFATDIFEQARVTALMKLWLELSSALLATPEAPIGTHALGSSADRNSWIQAASGPPGELPPSTALAQFEAHAASAREALVFGATRWTFRELNNHAARFAARLASDLPPGPIALQVPRSPELVALIFGAWKAGRAWLALDAGDPLPRKRQLVEAAGATALVSLDPRDAHALGLEWMSSALQSAAAIATTQEAATPGDIAYFMGTSGTTGTPKCIAVGHAALANHNTAAIACFGFTEADSVLARIPLTFDAALLEMITPLCLGARVVLASETEANDPRLVAQLATRERVTVLGGVPTWLESLFAEELVQAATHVRLFITGGEAIGPRVLEAWKQLAWRPAFINAYGPAEACIEATAYSVPRDATWPLPIGLPMGGMSVHVLDETGRPLPCGVEGELVIGGACVAHGYAKPNAEDAARFQPDHLQGAGRLYWTGDRAVRREDGVLEFRGRRDRERKVGGRRVDPSEIEAVLAEHPEVTAVAIVAEPSGPLVAHVEVPRPRSATLLAELQELVSARLPTGLWPATWRAHTQLPLQSSGKLDIARLAADPELGELLQAEVQPPRTALEAQLVELFTRDLGAPADRSTDYFRSGGNSLGAIGFVNTIRSTLNVPLRLADFFAAATPAMLAQHLEHRETPPDPRARWQRMHEDSHFEVARPLAAAREDGAILLTGATGFLGAFLLAELLRGPARNVFCLVRATDTKSARARIRANLQRYGFEPSRPELERIHALAGDLSAPRFAQSAATWQALTAELGHVLHNGAAVDFFRDYDALAKTNVEGTRTALQLACDAGARFGLVSTIGVIAPASDALTSPSEATPLAEIAKTQCLDGGYEETKWVAEAMTYAAHKLGLRTTVFRPGRISASAQESPGASNTDDFASRFLIGCLRLGLAPDLALGGAAEVDFDLTPVDFAAKAIASLSGLTNQGELQPGSTWHILHATPAPYRTLFDAAITRGHALQFAAPQVWLEEARSQASEDLAPLLATLQDLSADEVQQQLTPDAALSAVNSSASHEALRNLGIHAPAIDNRYAAAAIAFVESTGALDAPAR